jgi:hypothetical protein
LFVSSDVIEFVNLDKDARARRSVKQNAERGCNIPFRVQGAEHRLNDILLLNFFLRDLLLDASQNFSIFPTGHPNLEEPCN